MRRDVERRPYTAKPTRAGEEGQDFELIEFPNFKEECLAITSGLGAGVERHIDSCVRDVTRRNAFMAVEDLRTCCHTVL